MSWTDKTQIATSLSVAGTELFSDWVTLKSDETIHFQVKGNFPTPATDNLYVRVYATLDASSEVSDTTTVIAERILVNTTDPGYLSLSLSGYYKLRLGFVRTGATDTITVDAYYRTNGNYKDCGLDI